MNDMRIEVFYHNGVIATILEVDSWHLNTAGKIPFLQIQKKRNEKGRSELKIINLFSVYSFNVIEDTEV